MTLLCEGAGSHFVLEHSMAIYVMWPSALVTSCNKFVKNSCILVLIDQVSVFEIKNATYLKKNCN